MFVSQTATEVADGATPPIHDEPTVSGPPVSALVTLVARATGKLEHSIATKKQHGRITTLVFIITGKSGLFCWAALVKYALTVSDQAQYASFIFGLLCGFFLPSLQLILPSTAGANVLHGCPFAGAFESQLLNLPERFDPGFDLLK
jgi:hypothetical protein